MYLKYQIQNYSNKMYFKNHIDIENSIPRAARKLLAKK